METAVENNGASRNCLMCTVIGLERTGRELSLMDASSFTRGRGSLQQAAENDIMAPAILG
jgi:hypothetical protein